MPLASVGPAFEVKGTIGGSTELSGGSQGQERLNLELTALRVLNVENFAEVGKSGADVRKVDLGAALEARLGAANKLGANKQLRNVGPSITYKLRDSAGQAKEFHNYMHPIDMGDGGVPVYLLGVRENLADNFRYLRVPVDDQGGMQGFLDLRRALADPKQRAAAVQRYAAQVIDPARPDLGEQLRQSARRVLDLFATQGVDAQGQPAGGLPAISAFMQANVPEAERERASAVLIRILNGVLFELAQLQRSHAGLPALDDSETTRQFMTQAVLSLSDAQAYPAPLLLTLKDFQQVQASVFQVARAPGKKVVYLGCALLIIGIFAMLYVRERRLWIWLQPQGLGTHATMALSCNRKTLDVGREFVHLRHKLLGIAPDAHAPPTDATRA